MFLLFFFPFFLLLFLGLFADTDGTCVGRVDSSSTRTRTRPWLGRCITPSSWQGSMTSSRTPSICSWSSSGRASCMAIFGLDALSVVDLALGLVSNFSFSLHFRFYFFLPFFPCMHSLGSGSALFR
ncbi:hypothetical protein BDZ97DRAFT_1023858 [Flammula alnicola]|nr:hypothetical protein BDZ97DRAFT_1023858 [Flammula alnicola]